MKVNKEAAQLVAKALKECKVMETIVIGGVTKSVPRYSYERFISEHGLHSDKESSRLSERVFPCPFHEDEAPSFSINEEKDLWHCFSCERGGRYIDLLVEFDRVKLGLKMNYYLKLDRLLKADPALQAMTGLTTIFSNTNDFDINNIELFRFKPKYGVTIPSNYLELSTMLIKSKCSVEQIYLFILLMQESMSAEVIFREIFMDSKYVVQESGDKVQYFDISSLLTEG